MIPSDQNLYAEYVITADTFLQTWSTYELGSEALFKKCHLLPQEFKDKWNSYYYHRLAKFSWKIDQMEAWVYIERTRGNEPNKQYFVQDYKLYVIPVIFLRDKVGGAFDAGQDPKEDNPYNASRCITNCHQKFWGSVKFRGKGKLKYSSGHLESWKTTSIFNHQKNNITANMDDNIGLN